MKIQNKKYIKKDTPIEKDVEKLISNMDRYALKRLKARIDFLITFKKNQDNLLTEKEIFYQLLQEHIQKITKENLRTPYSIFVKNNPKFEDTFDTLEIFLQNTITSRNITRNDRLKVYSLFCTQIIAYLMSIEVPIYYKTIFNVSDRFPSLFEKAFPGYINAGIAHLVFDIKYVDDGEEG